MQQIPCIFCDTYQPREFWCENGFIGRKCPQCGLLYISPRPDADELNNLYSYDHASISAEDHIGSRYLKELDAQFKLKIINKFSHAGRLLEIGCGAGYFLNRAHQAGFDAVGIEPNEVLAKYAGKTFGLRVLPQMLEQDMFPKASFDIIYHCDVLSHFPDPIRAFSIMNALLSPNGIMVFETGNYGDISKGWLKLVGKLQYPDHLFLFSHASIARLFDATGFQQVEKRRFGIIPQLFLIKVVGAILSLLRSKNTKQNSESIPAQSGTGILRKIHALIQHFLRYHIACAVPFGPMTVIYVIKKNNGILE